MNLGFKKVIDGGNGNTLIFTALIAAMLANAVPTVADGWYFSLQQKWKQQLEENKITPEEYWGKDIFNYYTITAGYYGIVLLTMLALNKNTFSTNSKILLGLLGGGLVIAVGLKNVQKDKQIAELRKAQQLNKPMQSFTGNEETFWTDAFDNKY